MKKILSLILLSCCGFVAHAQFGNPFTTDERPLAKVVSEPSSVDGIMALCPTLISAEDMINKNQAFRDFDATINGAINATEACLTKMSSPTSDAPGKVKDFMTAKRIYLQGLDKLRDLDDNTSNIVKEAYNKWNTQYKEKYAQLSSIADKENLVKEFYGTFISDYRQSVLTVMDFLKTIQMKYATDYKDAAKASKREDIISVANTEGIVGLMYLRRAKLLSSVDDMLAKLQKVEAVK
ncbi:MAG: hypothetical protein MJZ20_02075 [Bacteroidaceae bacterium]|nr:hypothetical protein [Bacteroidaceae bacterium]